jgi:hypothetical protein
MSRMQSLRNVDWRAKLQPLYRYAMKLPLGVRSLAGLVLIVAGVLGIVLPILGFWMAPLGLMFIALDVPPWRRRVERWLRVDARPIRTGYQENGGSS